MLIERLSKLASEKSSERRVELLREITDLFLDGVELHREPELVLFDELMTRIVDDVTEAARSELAERIADVGRAPKTLVLRLASDIIGVARPILERSTVLTDGDLVDIATTQSDDHRYAISARQTLSSPVTDVLVSHGSARVLVRVAGNDGAELSPEGISTLVRQSHENELLEVTLASRRDSSASDLTALVPKLSAAIAEKLAALGMGERRGLDLQERLKHHLAETSRDLRDVVTMASQIRNGTAAVEDSVLKLARARRSYDLGALFGILTDIPRQIAIRAMQKREVEPLLVLCRTLGLSWATVSAILEMRSIRAREAYAPSRAMRVLYETLEAQAAERTVRILRVRARAADPA
jgi:uncharacterized protein (DUF2336 family)